MYGSHVHERVWQDYEAGMIQRTCVTMHYVTDEVDRGPIICQIPVEIDDCNSAKEVGDKVNKVEHEWQ
jgi:folate-dependent phosphoribosylglycinamide formyltransferase PurN